MTHKALDVRIVLLCDFEGRDHSYNTPLWPIRYNTPLCPIRDNKSKIKDFISFKQWIIEHMEGTRKTTIDKKEYRISSMRFVKIGFKRPDSRKMFHNSHHCPHYPADYLLDESKEFLEKEHVFESIADLERAEFQYIYSQICEWCENNGVSIHHGSEENRMNLQQAFGSMDSEENGMDAQPAFSSTITTQPFDD